MYDCKKNMNANYFRSKWVGYAKLKITISCMYVLMTALLDWYKCLI